MYAMEAIYDNVECVKLDNPTPSTNYTGQRSSKRSFYLGVILSLSLLTVFLLIGLITLSFFNHNLAGHVSAEAEKRDLLNKNISAVSNQLSSMTEERDILNKNISAVSNQLSSMTEERDILNKNISAVSNQLSSMNEERDLLTKKLLCFYNQNKQCPAGWSSFSCSCYLLSGRSDSWNQARKDCRDRGADLVVIDFAKEQEYLTRLTNTLTWIGLHDEEEEGRWKWVDGTPLNLMYWADRQPDNGGGDPKWGEEDCAHIRTFENTLWNDLSCTNSLPWVCEKIP
ncbi:C-type lectin domain family 4 member E [Oreochromis niloticus]|uniref:C-type lectin domain family 4 member E n=1 Tax=Oreochromis niloticus TaxID=8128 RepID=UPI000DF384B7|nr:C-type lectin domain family 4 member E-like [Oreochromis niloticus]